MSTKTINKPKISIVTPVFNGEDVIGDLILSIIDQNFPDWELILQDGGSSDNTLKVINSFNDERIRSYSEKDNGMYDALNKATKKASGEYLIHLNSDEQLIDNALDVILKEIDSKSGFDVYCFGVIIIDKKRKPRVFRKPYPQNQDFIKMLNFDVLTAGIVYRRSVFNEFSFRTDYRAVSDALFFIDLLKSKKIYYSKWYSSLFLIEGENLSMEPKAVEERSILRKSVKYSVLKQPIFYVMRKIAKIYYKCYKFDSSIERVRVYNNGYASYEVLSEISHKLDWDTITSH